MRATDTTAADAPTLRPANRRELILEAAVELFHRHGYPATSVADIGKAVAVALGRAGAQVSLLARRPRVLEEACRDVLAAGAAEAAGASPSVTTVRREAILI